MVNQPFAVHVVVDIRCELLVEGNYYNFTSIPDIFHLYTLLFKDIFQIVGGRWIFLHSLIF